jgi:hypothetical protein
MSKFTERIQQELARLGSDADVDMVESCMKCETPDLSGLDETTFAKAVKSGINNIRMDGTGMASYCLEERRKGERRQKERRKGEQRQKMDGNET